MTHERDRLDAVLGAFDALGLPLLAQSVYAKFNSPMYLTPEYRRLDRQRELLDEAERVVCVMNAAADAHMFDIHA